MKSQSKQLIALGVLIILLGISWRVNRIPPSPPLAVKPASRASQQDSLLKTRFHRVRAEEDALYHYRIKPAPFESHDNPFRLSPGMEGPESNSAAVLNSKSTATEIVPAPALETGDPLLKHAVAGLRIGGVVTMDHTTQLTVDGQLHKEGDVFTTRLSRRVVLIRIVQLSTTYVMLSLDDPAQGHAEVRVRLK